MLSKVKQATACGIIASGARRCASRGRRVKPSPCLDRARRRRVGTPGMKIDSGIFIADLRDVARLARYAEELGYDGLWTAEAGHDPYLPVALAATATERITLGTNIAVAFPRRRSSGRTSRSTSPA